jgi:hypothetical protein
VAYDDHVRTHLDLWTTDSEHPAPLIAFIHGGGFRGGDKRQVRRRYGRLIRVCRRKGIAFASINYCLTGDGVDVLHCLHDCARAMQFLRHRADSYNLDRGRFAAFGGSAGAGTSLWLGTHDDLADPDSGDPVERQSTRLSAAGALNGQCTYDFTRWPQLIGPPPEQARYLDEMKRLYGVDSRDELREPGFKEMRRELDMLLMLDESDAPLFLFSTGPLENATSSGHYIHHPRHAVVLHEKAQQVGLDSKLLLPARHDSARPMQRHLLRFFSRHLNVGGDIGR